LVDVRFLQNMIFDPIIIALIVINYLSNLPVMPCFIQLALKL
jgi:hypothetical protein